MTEEPPKATLDDSGEKWWVGPDYVYYECPNCPHSSDIQEHCVYCGELYEKVETKRMLRRKHIRDHDIHRWRPYVEGETFTKVGPRLKEFYESRAKKG